MPGGENRHGSVFDQQKPELDLKACSRGSPAGSACEAEQSIEKAKAND
jgi:hypothetical protein